MMVKSHRRQVSSALPGMPAPCWLRAAASRAASKGSWWCPEEESEDERRCFICDEVDEVNLAFLSWSLTAFWGWSQSRNIERKETENNEIEIGKKFRNSFLQHYPSSRKHSNRSIGHMAKVEAAVTASKAADICSACIINEVVLSMSFAHTGSDHYCGGLHVAKVVYYSNRM